MLWLFKIKFRGFRRFLIHGNSNYAVLYTQCLRYNICSAWFIDIRISTCSVISCGGRRTKNVVWTCKTTCKGSHGERLDQLVCELTRVLIISSQSMNIAVFSTWGLREQGRKSYEISYWVKEELLVSQMFSHKLCQLR